MTNSRTAIAVFSACQQSHPFEERRVPLTEECVKIGRSVARLRPGKENAIFDCKVLSRNHAVLWYEDRHFYLRDTKSSNGTFVNNQRLSKGSEESPPKNFYSGDIVQFGVDIIENAKKVTHGCIVAMVRLFHPDGMEAIDTSTHDSTDSISMDHSVSLAPSAMFAASPGGGLSSQELYQLQQYIREASHREQMLEAKLENLQTLLASTHEASESSWQALIDEDRLLSRIEMLESQLQLYSKNATEDKLRDEVVNLHQEKERYETTAKESLRRALQEKVEAIQKLSDVERSLETTEENCSRLREQCESAHNELETLAEKHTDACRKLDELNDEMKEADRRYADIEAESENAKSELERKLAEMSQQEVMLHSKIDSIQSERDFVKEQLVALSVQAQQTTDSEGNNTVESVSSPDDRVEQLTKLLNETRGQVDNYKEQLQQTRNELATDRQKLGSLQDELRRTKEDLVHSNQRATFLDDRLKTSNEQLGEIVERATSDLIKQLEGSVVQKERNEDLMNCLRRFADDLETGVRDLWSKNIVLNGPSMQNGECISAKLATNGFSSPQSSDSTLSSPDDAIIADELAKAIQAQRLSETELYKYKDELLNAHSAEEKSQLEINSLRNKLQQSEHFLSQTTVKHDRLQEQLNIEKDLKAAAHEELAQTKSQLGESEALLEQKVKELVQIKDKLQLLTEENAFEKSVRSTSDLGTDKARLALHRQAAKNQAEFAGLKEECGSLRQRILAIESEMKTSRKENCRLSSENRQLQEAHQSLMQLKDRIEINENEWQYQADAAKYEADIIRNQEEGCDEHLKLLYDTQLNEAREQVGLLQQQKAVQDAEMQGLRRRLDEAGYDFDYEELALRARTITVCSAVPLFILILAFFMAYLPFLSWITATNDGNS